MLAGAFRTVARSRSQATSFAGLGCESAVVRSSRCLRTTSSLIKMASTSTSTSAAFSASDPKLGLYVASSDTPVAALEGRAAFTGLDETEARYAHSFYKACWDGYKITLLQTSAEAPALFELLRGIYSDGAVALRAAALAAGVTEADVDAFIVYSATVFENCGPYRSFGDTKILPGLAPAAFEAIVRAAPAFARPSSGGLLVELWDAVKGAIYDVRPRVLQLGMPTAGVTTYYSADFSEEDAALISRFIKAKSLLQPYNSRVFKARSSGASSEAGAARYVIRLASALTTSSTVEVASGKGAISGTPYDDAASHLLLGDHAFEGATISIVRGDYAPLMARVAGHLAAAQAHAANDTQARMLARYIDSFRTGSQEAHIDGSREWVKDVGPVVESYIGFIESYRDPMGVRGEWEGFVAVVNKEASAKFGALVGAAEGLLPLLPWGRAFERDRFARPDFTSLEVLAFGGSGVPAGINIPNYDEVRQAAGGGFKNVSLANVLAARDYKDRITFLADADQDVFKRCAGPSFEVQVGVHELLGHGSGKVFTEDAAGALNFDRSTVVDPDSGKPIASWYKAGESWDSVFGSLASTMEECRAEAVGLYLCVEPKVLEIFGHAHSHGAPAAGAAEGGAGGASPAPAAAAADADDIVYVNWLNMARAGLLALQVYTPSPSGAGGSWGQAHMQARYVLLRVMLEAGGGLLELPGLDKILAAGRAGAAACAEGDAGLHVRLDRSKIRSVGIPAVGAFLRRLQVAKSTADAAGGRAMYERLCAVPEEWLAVRELVISKRKARQMLVQPVLQPLGAEPHFKCESEVTRGKAQRAVQLRSFPATPAGLCDSMAHRFPEPDADLLSLWRADRPHHVV